MQHTVEAKQKSEESSQVKHTKGPWKYSGKKKTSDKLSGLWDKNIHDTAGFQIAMAVEQDSQFETEANARLIAAAPDLLEALELCREQLSQWLDCVEAGKVSPEDAEALKKASYAIDKAIAA